MPLLPFKIPTKMFFKKDFLSNIALAILPSCATDGNGGFCCLVLTASSLARYILGVVGAVALGFFIFAGYKMITAAGDSGKFKNGQNIMVNTVIGIVLVFLAWTLVNITIVTVTTGKIANTTKYFHLDGLRSSWYDICTEKNQ